MIVKIKGKLLRKEKDRVHLGVGGLVYEILISEYTYEHLKLSVNNELQEFVIYEYMQADSNRIYPVFIGFLNELEKEFFEMFIKVSGIGPKAALRAFRRPLTEIARAIEEGDINYLKSLPSIGLQRAKNIVAFLQGKIGRFLLIKESTATAMPKTDKEELKSEAVEVLLQLQYKKREAKEMVDKALKSNIRIESLEELLNEIYRQKNIRAYG
ncbi:MAG: hypothetical protein J7J25_02040 [Candidatus Omnitrophica bacterium]|nr:hypothetical protein [Candidatus Omnitrophota bacterium]